MRQLFLLCLKMVCTLVIGFSLSGCIIPHIIDSVERTGVTEGGRERSLKDTIKEFHNALYWGKTTDLSPFMAPEARRSLVKDIVKNKRQEQRIVQNEVQSVTFDDDVVSAEVLVAVKYYKVPLYVVRERIEREEWGFYAGSGWLLESRTIEEEI